ncbi:hypothetical protein ACFVWC_26755 [Bacillus mycoides]|uniref:hypothetical protein n=1 Tax=Bacillus TaxID=1386 RepID=UPI001F5BED67|nr:hypothetical protein [Bacillus sp. TH25]
MKEFQEKMSSNETVQGMITTYYEMQNGISDLVGVPNGNSTPVRGILAYTEKQLLFYSEVFGKIPISLQIPFHQINEIKEKNKLFPFLKRFQLALFPMKIEMFFRHVEIKRNLYV